MIFGQNGQHFFNRIRANIAKKGYLLYQENAAQDLWVKRWFVVRRPYIYTYTNDTETDEQGVINVGSVRIDYNEALEQMIQVKKFFDFPPPSVPALILL
jgi:kinesin family protein 1